MHVMRMKVAGCGLALALLVLIPSAAYARNLLDDDYAIMRPEPGVAPRYKSPRAMLQRVTPPRPAQSLTPLFAEPPPPIVLQGSVRALPNLATPAQGYVPGGRTETFGDRAVRCSHQAGLYGVTPDQYGTYIGTCTNQ